MLGLELCKWYPKHTRAKLPKSGINSYEKQLIKNMVIACGVRKVLKIILHVSSVEAFNLKIKHFKGISIHMN